MYKNNSRNSSKLNGCSSLQLSCNLTGKCHANGYYSYTNRYTRSRLPKTSGYGNREIRLNDLKQILITTTS
ncbi:hypothetical protein SAMN05444285_13755 [Draconibacterium orientale]|uniref:Uncharacterized protein n=1 Tax=Draconibacterium orientale TaxID=1168034 RepID=A0A1I0J4K5_9BACT|nr:hypothetical protein SAMN05444285_13755 [Draconibacterium orientale]